MSRCRTALAIAVWLTVAVTSTFGQDGRPGTPPPPPPAGPGAGPAMIPGNLAGVVPSVLPVNLSAESASPGSASPVAPPSAPAVASPPSDPRLDWSLGDYGPTTRFVAGDLYPPGQTTGWYAGFDLGIMKPRLNVFHVTTPAGFTGPAGTGISLPAAPLNWAGVPQINVGYRLGQGAGELQLGYRLLDSSGTQSLPGFEPFPAPAQLRTRLSVQTIDLDYISSEWIAEKGDVSRFFYRDLRSGVGLRVASAFFDSRASGFPISDTHVSSNFGGVGPRMFLELHQDLFRPDFQFYTRIAASGVLGSIRQQFSQTEMAGTIANFGTFDTHNEHLGIGILQAEAGFSWEPNALSRRLRITAAYSWERWWRFGNTNYSDAELTVQGLLLRATYRY